VKEFAEGSPRRALYRFAGRGLLTLAENRDGAMHALIGDWAKEGVTSPQDNLIFTGYAKEAATLNRLAQAERKQAGELTEKGLSVGGNTIYEGDQVLFTKNSRLYRVKNGTIGTVERIDEDRQSLRVVLKNGERTTFSLPHYDHLTLGYAMTTHKGQGVTVENAYVLVGGSIQDREISYVQASRARGVTRLFAERLEQGETIDALAQQMQRSGMKTLASSYVASRHDYDIEL
jgi:ATP-dependent exoDNAse (exonuclease V) alpha subunit